MIAFSGINFVRNSLDADGDLNITENFDNIKFKKFPNIYLFWLESFHSLDIQKKFFNIDTTNLANYLDQNRFTLLPETFSSGSWTLWSFIQLYSLGRIESVQEYGISDVRRDIRKAIGGDKNNLVYRVLKNNGYTTIHLTKGSAYYFNQQGTFLDDTDVAIKDKLALLHPIMAVNYWWDKLAAIPDDFRYIESDSNGYHGSLEERVKLAMSKGKRIGKPFMVSFKGGAQHTPYGTGWTWEQRKPWIESGYYQAQAKQGTEELQHIVDHILAEDPEALIILLGNHGSTTYRDFPKDGPDEPYDSCKKFGVNPQDLLDDLYKVLFAYRLPNGDKFDLTYGKYMNNINVFTHIFAYLAEDEEILKHRVRSECSYGQSKMVEGKLLPRGSDEHKP